MKADILSAYPDYQIDIDKQLSGLISNDEHVFVVLDDDPTGVQCVHDINVYTDWTYESMKEAFDNKLFFILTNSRALTESESKTLHQEIIDVISKVSKDTGKKYFYISRGDSTLRGHYPMETDILAKGLINDYGKVDGQILLPFFKEGGRFTIDDVHYVKYGDELIPCAETEFAKDKTFGYKSSDLKEYIEEKSNGKILKEDVRSVSLDDLRSFNIDKIYDLLMKAENDTKIIVNAIAEDDVKVFCIALYKAIAQNKVFNFRSAAALVKCIGGISTRPLLQRDEMIGEETENGGLIIIGSHTDKTTRQLNNLLTIEGIESLQFECSKILESDEAFQKEIDRCVTIEEELISQGKTVAVYTERVLLSFADDDPEKALKRSVRISEGVYQLVKNLKVKPAFVVAKGGITSADVGVKGLGIRKALVLGQIEPGIPVWKALEEAKFPNIPYIIFPGNVGEDDTLKNAVRKLLSK
ncbi:MAG: hypothetical protein J6S49_05475 [Erysipelotrichaceae bacterium]|nr:hypothetical protein [Erysipelotrichaceae bacterium]